LQQNHAVDQFHGRMATADSESTADCNPADSSPPESRRQHQIGLWTAVTRRKARPSVGTVMGRMAELQGLTETKDANTPQTR